MAIVTQDAAGLAVVAGSASSEAQTKDKAAGAFQRGQDEVEKAINKGNTTVKETERILCRPGVFGEQITEFNPQGRPGKHYMSVARAVMVPADRTACDDDVCSDGECDGKAVLIFRGGCGFYANAKNVRSSSKGTVAGIILADNAEATNGMPMTMSRGGEEKHEYERFLGSPIVAVFKEVGEEIEKHIADGNVPLFGMNLGKWKDRENQYMLKEQIKQDKENSMSWHNLAIAYQNQGLRKQAISALQAGVTKEKPAIEMWTMLADVLKTDGQHFLSAKAFCGAAMAAATVEIAAGHRPKKSNEHRVSAMKALKGTFEGDSMMASETGPCDMAGIEDAQEAKDLFRGKPFAKKMYPDDPDMWAEADQQDDLMD